jgi:hypothetical protein
MPLLIDCDATGNLDEPCQAVFNPSGEARPLRLARLWRGGAWRWCALAAWSAAGPSQAWMTPIEESGDGPALLLHGGEEGLRLQELDGPDASIRPWSLDDRAQWGEAFLIVTPETAWRA